MFRNHGQQQVDGWMDGGTGRRTEAGSINPAAGGHSIFSVYGPVIVVGETKEESHRAFGGTFKIFCSMSPTCT